MTLKSLRIGLIGAALCGLVVLPYILATDRAVARQPDDREKNELPAAVWNVLESPDRYELLSIDPTSPFHKLTSKPSPSTRDANSVNGFTSFGGVSVEAAETRQQLNEALRESMRAWPRSYSFCTFQPRHALRAIKGDTTVEVLICFRCGDVQASVNGKVRGYAHVSSETPPIFTELLKAAKIHVDGEDKP